MITSKRCSSCKETKSIEWFSKDKHRKDGFNSKCRLCCKKSYSKWAKNALGAKPMNENQNCAQYLGIVVAEKVLSLVFKDVKRMPLHNHGYDFICSKGFKIDVKSSDKISRTKNSAQWQFDIRKNTGCDFFLCIAFDRKILQPLKMWLIPNHVVSHLETLSIGKSSFYKWSTYEQPIDKVLECCDTLKS